jgi:ELWxxDGT repeat protein
MPSTTPLAADPPADIASGTPPRGRTQYPVVNISGTLFFAAAGGSTGQELRKSDGTSAGTQLVKDINPGSLDSHPQNLTNVNGNP